MTHATPVSRRTLLVAGLSLGTAATPAAAAPRTARDNQPANAFGIEPNATRDQSRALQAAIDQTSARGAVLQLAPGHYQVGDIVLRANTRIVGVPGATVLRYNGLGTFFTAASAKPVQLTGLVFDGQSMPLNPAWSNGLLALDAVTDLVIDDCIVKGSSANGIVLKRSAGRVMRTRVSNVTAAGLFSLDADISQGSIEFAHNHVHDCADNGILVWRSSKGEDGTRLIANHVERIANRSGGTGEYGNGINVFRAGSVQAASNRITDCSYSAIRGNAASNISMTANAIARIGEVALYAEFGFEGALIANNIIDGAATGISVTNFNDGGRLAVIQGNLVRNLYRREHEPADKRGEGITVEADAVVSNNVIENAPTAGIAVGWGRYMRDVNVNGNVIRQSRIGIVVSGDAQAGACLITANLISGAADGAVRAMDHARAIGGDLTAAKTPQLAHVTVSGNVVR